ncbi:MAG: cytochrome c biogenesis protein [Spirochaetota bacterium]
MNVKRAVQCAVLFVCMALSSAGALLYAPADIRLGESSRLLYIHVPMAFSSVLAFVLSGMYALLFLMKKKSSYQYCFHNAAVLGVVFTLLTTATGAVWAHIAWGVWWNWDPRETSIVFLLVVYIAYFALCSAMEHDRSSGKYRAAYLIFAAAVMPFFVFAAPRIYPSLHPDTLINSGMKMQLSAQMRAVLFFSMASWGFLAWSLYNLANRISKKEQSHE